MRILVNDANILIDLVTIDLVDAFGLLGDLLYTTDFVFGEIDDAQRRILEPLVDQGLLNIITTSAAEDYEGIYSLTRTARGLSFEDCTVWYYCQKLNGILITGDARLKKVASEHGIEVRGILFVFDTMLMEGVISFDTAIDRMNRLVAINARLPRELIDDRLSAWAQGRHAE
jgi:rRNA-processing protein FCF1